MEQRDLSKKKIIEEKAAEIRLLILDVDGVMTDGRVLLNEMGEEIKSFNIKDGYGLKMLIETGVEVVIISGRTSKAVDRRAKDLGIQEIYQGVADKERVCAQIIERKKLKKANICCMGDDLPDLPLFHQSGISVAVADAAPELRHAATFVTKNGGGRGAVRELCELILKAKKKWPWCVVT
ncbi:MAG: HAD hydrolase family protein [Desulfobacteraceae bacterium]|jgi:YrbI family 3-deoxy-D-manno-octulosonate 8-phosphate phosphatase